jgi:hypothetical protein
VPKAMAALEVFVRERMPADMPVHPIATYGSVYKEILRVAAEIRRISSSWRRIDPSPATS